MTAVKTLWREAPAWRVSLILAIASTALVFVYPPDLKRFLARPVTPALAPSSYHSVPTVHQGQASPIFRPSTIWPNSLPTVNQGQASPAPVSQSPAPSAPAVATPSLPNTAYGAIVEDYMPFAGRSIPLPAGSWRVVASLPANNDTGVKFDMKALANEDNGKLIGFIELIGNEKAPLNQIGFRADGNCERSDIIFSKIRRNEDFGDQDCQYIDFLVPQDDTRNAGDNLLRAALGDLKERGVALPSTLVGVAFRFGNRSRLLIAKFYFNPEAHGVASSVKLNWLDNDWNKYNLVHHPEKQRYVERLKSWLFRWEAIMRNAWTWNSPVEIDAQDRVMPD